jgi:hypothetical protein
MFFKKKEKSLADLEFKTFINPNKALVGMVPETWEPVPLPGDYDFLLCLQDPDTKLSVTINAFENDKNLSPEEWFQQRLTTKEDYLTITSEPVDRGKFWFVYTYGTNPHTGEEVSYVIAAKVDFGALFSFSFVGDLETTQKYEGIIRKIIVNTYTYKYLSSIQPDRFPPL